MEIRGNPLEFLLNFNFLISKRHLWVNGFSKYFKCQRSLRMMVVTILPIGWMSDKVIGHGFLALYGCCRMWSGMGIQCSEG